ncbi:MAG: 3-dehydroquinate dehydratase [Flavobacteriales bacterium]|nr:3-dehydroquinate dehydratase [Flavobacteriales bacterium]MBT5090099.1 3-dehydroquinate dehydratase [Flavobacteriales bacterium]MBT5750041.1 3-dehydroquinate dehydratase [Flavobacteriales bacterium]
MKVMIINGPNLNLLGKREEAIYGNISFDDYLKTLKDEFPKLVIDYYQSNVEGELINKLQEVGFSYDYILLNAGGYTHTSVALTDCVKAIETPVIEVHISNIYFREDFRKKSLLSPNCKAVICGLGLDSYKAGLLTLK